MVPRNRFGDEKDRVVRSNGARTYFASDIAYHLSKREQLRAAGRHPGRRSSRLPGTRARGSRRHGAAGGQSRGAAPAVRHAVSRRREGADVDALGRVRDLRELRSEVGNDAARFFYVMRSNDQHLDFDLELAKSQSNDNPVYYIQYAHARVCSVMRQLVEKGTRTTPRKGRASLSQLTEPHELALLTSLSRYPEVIETSALQRAPHTLVHYLRDVANDFHTYYNAHTFIVEDAPLRDARLTRLGLRQVVANGLALLGVSAPEKM